MRELLKLLGIHYLLIIFIGLNASGVYFFWTYNEEGNLLLQIVNIFFIIDILIAAYFIIVIYIKIFREFQLKIYEI